MERLQVGIGGRRREPAPRTAQPQTGNREPGSRCEREQPQRQVRDAAIEHDVHGESFEPRNGKSRRDPDECRRENDLA